MYSKNQYAIVGAFVVFLSLTAVVISLWLTSGLSHVSYHRYLIRTDESVAGLSIKAPVKYNGVNVGFVRDITINERYPELVELHLDIENSLSIPDDSRAFLEGQGLTGIMYINLRGGKNINAPLTVARGETYPLIPMQPALLSRLERRLQTTADNLARVGDSLNHLLSESNQKSITAILENTAKASAQFPALLKQSQSTLKTLNKTGAQIDLTLQSSHLLFNNLENSVLPELNNNLQQLNQITDNLAIASEEIRDNPAIIIRGKKLPPKGPGEH